MVRLTCLLSLIFILQSSQLYADQSQALNAMAQGDYRRAATILQNLANEGDAEAQYNLALLYQTGNGVNLDNNLSSYWLAMAARQGLTQAYLRLNSKSLQPSDTRTPAPAAIHATQGPEDWVASQDPGYYTLQLASSTNRQLIAKYYEDNQLDGHAGYYRSKREGEEWYALVYGSYPSVQDAKDAIDSLPADLKKWSPWVRNIKSIHRIMLH
jgi:septal ring-binding cell division protein DamX